MIKYKNKKNKKDVIDLLILFSMFLYSLNFINKSNYLILNTLALVVIWMLVKNSTIYIPKEFLILTMCFTSYFFIYIIYFPITIANIIVFWIGPLIGYFIGCNLIEKNSALSVENIILVNVSGLFIHGMLNMVLYFNYGYNGRVVPDFWTRSNLAATLQGTLFSMIVSLLFYIIFVERKKINRILIIICIIFSVYATLKTATRTLLYLIIIVFFGNILLYIYLNKERKSKVIKFTIRVFISFILVATIYNINLFNIKEIYINSPLHTRMSSEYQTEQIADPRFEMQKFVISNMLEYPMGGNKMGGPLNYAHNLWLDTAKMVGIIPFLLLTVYTLSTILTLYRFIKSSYIEDKDKYIIMSVYLSLFMNFMMEPILEGVPHLFIIMCIVNGVTNKKLIIKGE